MKRNIFRNGETLVIGDLGLVKSAESIVSQMAGTINYMSPESIDGKKIGFFSDIWSFGCVLYEITELKQLYPGRHFGLTYDIAKGPIKETGNELINNYYKRYFIYFK